MHQKVDVGRSRIDLNEIVASRILDQIIPLALTPDIDVVPGAAEQYVIACATIDGVVACAAIKSIVSSRAKKKFIFRRRRRWWWVLRL